MYLYVSLMGQWINVRMYEDDVYYISSNNWLRDWFCVEVSRRYTMMELQMMKWQIMESYAMMGPEVCSGLEDLD